MSKITLAISYNAFNFNCTVPISVSDWKSIFNLMDVCNVVTSSIFESEHLSLVLNIVPSNSDLGLKALRDEWIDLLLLLYAVSHMIAPKIPKPQIP